MLENDIKPIANNFTVLISLYVSKIRKKKERRKMTLAVELGAEPSQLQITAGPKAESFKAKPTRPFGWLKSLLLSDAENNT